MAFVSHFAPFKPIAAYIAIVSLVYIFAFLTAGFAVGYLDVSSSDAILAMWPIPLAALGLSAFVTLGTIWRYGDDTGSIYFLPTVIHGALLLIGVIHALSELWGG